MALIKCTECGKEFSDKAQCCPQCACPTNVILQNNSQSDEKSKIIASYNILGYKFDIDEKMDFRLRLISEFNSKASIIEKSIEEVYDQLGSIDNVIETIPEFLADALEANIRGAVKMLTDNNVYEYDEQHFFEKYGDQLDASTIMEPVITRYLKIQGLHDEVEEYHRQLRYAHKNSWQGGGFGIKGAIKGHLKAQMLNAGTSFLTSFSDNKVHNENLQEIRNAKKALYNDADTKQSVINATLTLFTNCFACVLNEFKLAGKINDTFFNSAKANSIVNNVWKYIHEREEHDTSFLNAQCIEAFKADPINRDVLHLIFLSEEDSWDDPHDADLMSYAQEYNFLSDYIDYRIDIIAREYDEEIEEFKESIGTTIQSYDKFAGILSNYDKLGHSIFRQCHWIKRAYISEKLKVEHALIYAISEYLKYDKTLEDNQRMIGILEIMIEESISEEGDSEFSEETLNYFEEVIEALKCERVMDYNSTNFSNLIEKVCFSHSNDHNCTSAHGFYFANTSDIKKIENFKYYKACGEIPNDAKIYMLCAKMQYAPMTAKCVFAVTNYGIYVYQNQTEKLEEIQFFCSWHNLQSLDFEICANGGIYFDGKLFKEYSWELLHILSDLKKKVSDFLNNHEKYKSELSEMSTEDRVLTESEVNEIDRYYETSNESLGKKFYHIVKQNYQSPAAKAKINEKKAELLERIKLLQEQQYYTAKKITFGNILSGIIWLVIGLYIFLKWGGVFKFVWRILGGFFILCGVSAPFMAYSEAKEQNEKGFAEAMEYKDELKEIETLFVISNNDISIK